MRGPAATERTRVLIRAAPLILIAAAVLVVGCGQGATSADSGRLQVVAAENFWGSIAQQLGGDRVEVTSIITSPATDPHDYEPTSDDAQAMAGARIAIVNGIGYDSWAQKLLDANPTPGRLVLNVGDLLGLKTGDNPHQWYSPPAVKRVISQIIGDYERADPKDRAYFERRQAAFENKSLARYHQVIDHIRSRYSGTPVGASESIFAPLASVLGLRLLTPRGFLDAISEGTEPTPGDKTEVDHQLANHEVKVWVYNRQNATPDVQRLNEEARAAGIPIATVTETLSPAGASFQAWQVRELESVRAALAKAAGQ
jgi:zinc/manganese transport system substrate-binding protein